MSKAPRKTLLSRIQAVAKGPATATDTRAASLLAEQADLQRRAERLAARLTIARQSAEDAAAERRERLLADPVDEVALKRAERACNEANGGLAAVEELIRETEVSRVAVEARIAEVRAAEERARVAAERRAAVVAFEADVTELSRITAEMAATYERFRQTAYVALPEAASETIGEVRSHILHAAFPLAFGPPPFSLHPDLDAAAAANVGRVHREIDAFEAGTSGAPAAPPPAYIPPAIFPDVAIVLCRPAFYRTALGSRVDIPAGGVMLPEPIAAEAVRLDVGFGMETPDGKAIIGILMRSPAARIERGTNGRFTSIAATGVLGSDGKGGSKGTPPGPPPADLGILPAAVDLAEAAE